jgi:hypothetical protein
MGNLDGTLAGKKAVIFSLLWFDKRVRVVILKAVTGKAFTVFVF